MVISPVSAGESNLGSQGHCPVPSSGQFLYAYGTQANANQVGLL